MRLFLKKGNLIFINDSKATSFTSTQSALSSLKNIYWILGGLPKKGDKINFSKYKKNILKCYLIGKNINFFESKIKGKLQYSITKNLKNSIIEILNDYKYLQNKNAAILLSPAAASFDQFKNFEERGDEFKDYVIDMQDNSFKFFLLLNYWRSLDKKVLICFLILFF